MKHTQTKPKASMSKSYPPSFPNSPLPDTITKKEKVSYCMRIITTLPDRRPFESVFLRPKQLYKEKCEPKTREHIACAANTINIPKVRLRQKICTAEGVIEPNRHKGVPPSPLSSDIKLQGAPRRSYLSSYGRSYPYHLLVGEVNHLEKY